MTVLSVLIFALAGSAAGLVHFRALRRQTELLAAGGPAGRIVALYLLRLAATVGVLTLAAVKGWPALLAAAAGLLVARHFVVAKARAA